MATKEKTFIKNFQYRIYPNEEQQQHLAKVFGSCRFVHNNLLTDVNKITNDEKLKEIYSSTKHIGLTNGKPNWREFRRRSIIRNLLKKSMLNGISFTYLNNKLIALKASYEHKWLNDCSENALYNAIENLHSAYDKFSRNKAKRPKFKLKENEQTALYTDGGFILEDNRLNLGDGLLSIKIKFTRELPNKPIRLTMLKTRDNKYYVSFVCKYSPVKSNGTGIIGVDAGITNLAIISDGTIIPNIKTFSKYKKKFNLLKRRLSEKKKNSVNERKANLKLSKLHTKIRNSRNDYLHKLTTKLVRENQAICIESLNIKKLTDSKHMTNHILDAAWGRMRDYLIYKAEASQHCKILLADPYFPSTQLCSICDTVPQQKIKLGISKWTCINCGSKHERDYNASKNLEKLALSSIRYMGVLESKESVFRVRAYSPTH